MKQKLKPFKVWILKNKADDYSYSCLIHKTKHEAIEINQGDKECEAVQVLITPIN